MTIFDKFLINNRTKSYDDCLVEALADFDFNLHWAMCHNEVNRILGRGGSEEIRYKPVNDWNCVSHLSAASEWLKSGGKPRKDLAAVPRALARAEPWSTGDSFIEQYRKTFGVWHSKRQMRAVLNRAEGI